MQLRGQLKSSKQESRLSYTKKHLTLKLNTRALGVSNTTKEHQSKHMMETSSPINLACFAELPTELQIQIWKHAVAPLLQDRISPIFIAGMAVRRTALSKTLLEKLASHLYSAWHRDVGPIPRFDLSRTLAGTFRLSRWIVLQYWKRMIVDVARSGRICYGRTVIDVRRELLGEIEMLAKKAGERLEIPVPRPMSA